MDQSRIPSPVPTVRIIASCTNGKRCPVPPDLRLGQIAHGPLTQRLAAWTDRLQQGTTHRVAAVDLYRGHHWSVVRGLPTVAEAAGHKADLWVASAGYGLIPAEAHISPYSATFAASEVDSVWRVGDGDRRTALRAWWDSLQTMPGPVTGAPRSLTELASTTPDATILVIASPAYIGAMADDLSGARSSLTDPQRLIVISSRDESFPEWLAPHLVPSEASLSYLLGGSRGSLHARTARRILQESGAVPLRATTLVSLYTRLVSESQRPTPAARLKLGDENVRSFIRSALAVHGSLTCTAALRKLRSTGQACEQRRFAGLYAEVTRNANAS